MFHAQMIASELCRCLHKKEVAMKIKVREGKSLCIKGYSFVSGKSIDSDFFAVGEKGEKIAQQYIDNGYCENISQKLEKEEDKSVEYTDKVDKKSKKRGGSKKSEK